jgi:hypothetical protein
VPHHAIDCQDQTEIPIRKPPDRHAGCCFSEKKYMQRTARVPRTSRSPASLLRFFFSRRRRDRGASASVSNFCFDRWCPVLQEHGFHMCLLCGGEHAKVFLPCMEAACRIAFHAAQIRADYLTSSALGSFRFQVWIACVAPER